MSPGRALPRLSLIVMDPLSKSCRVPLTQKNGEGPGRCCVQERHYETARDGLVVRLICSSGSGSEESSDHCPDQTSLTDSGRFRSLDSGQIPKLYCLCFSLSYLFFAHYNIQPDIVSGWPCVTSVRNHGTHF